MNNKDILFKYITGDLIKHIIYPYLLPKDKYDMVMVELNHLIRCFEDLKVIPFCYASLDVLSYINKNKI